MPAARPDSKDVRLSLAVAAASFALILPAELPDKTAVASVVLGTRNHALPVFAGAAAAFAVQVAIAVIAGNALALLPRQPVYAITAALFVLGAILVLRLGRDQAPAVEDPVPVRPGFWRPAAASFVVVAIAEFGDLTQILIANLAARYHDPLSVSIGSVVALWTVAALATLSGRGLLRIIPLRVVTVLAAAAMTAMAALSVVSAVEA